MKKKIKILLKFLRRLTVLDWLVILVILAGLVFLAIFIFKEEKWVKVEVKIARPEWWWESNPPPYWLADQIKKGDEQYDSLGRKVVEVLDVETYEWSGGRKMTYLTLNLKVEVDRRKRRLKFNHRPLEIGKEIDLELGGIGTQGLVAYIEGMPDARVWENKIVEVRLIERQYFEVFPETLGVMPWKAEAIKVGDQMKDTWGRVVAEILGKEVEPAEKIVVVSDGRILLRRDPIKKDVTLVVKLKTFRQEGVNYFLYDLKVKVGSSILLALPEIDIWPEVIKIIE